MTAPAEHRDGADSRRAFCFVLLPSQDSFVVSNVVEQIRIDFGVTAEVLPERRSTLSFETTSGKAILTQSNIPIPNREASQAAAGNVFWKDGDKAADQHESHIVVFASSPGDNIDAAIFLTSVIRTILNATEAIGVYWGNGKIANSKDFFLKASTNVERSKLPLHLWVRFQLMQSDDGLYGFTVGMKQFLHQEIYTSRCDWEPRRLAGCIYDAAHYVVSGSVILKEGDTMGSTDTDRFEIRFAPHPHRPEERITQIQLA